MRRRDGAGQRAGQEEHTSSDYDYYYCLANQAYPDMLMIGVQGQCPDEGKTGKLGPWAGGFVQPTITEQRTHFG